MNIIRKVKNIVFKNRIRTIIAAVLLALVIFFVWYFAGARKQAPQYQTATVEKGTIVSAVSVSGQVVTTGRLPILSQASGQVGAVYVKNGDAVTFGQKILTIALDPVASQKNASAWSSYLSAKTTLDSAQASLFSTQSTMFTKWKTYLDLATNSTYQNGDLTPNDPNRTAAVFHSAQDDWLAAEAGYKNQQGVVAQAQAALNSTWQSYELSSPDLVAPATGVIQDLTYVPGMLINSSVSSGVTNYPATIQLDASPREILPNMSVSANIIVAAKENALLVPSEAIQIQNNSASIRILKNGQPQSVSVQTGLSSDTQTEITAGLSEGDAVITGTVTTTTQTGQSPFSTFRVGGFGGGGLRPGGGR